MSERLTLGEIYERHPEQWVLLGDHEPAGDYMAGSATVLYVGDDRNEALDVKFYECRNQRTLLTFTSPPVTVISCNIGLWHSILAPATLGCEPDRTAKPERRTAVTERMTMSEIHDRYPRRWLLLGDLDSDRDTLEIFSAKVLFESENRADVYRKACDYGNELVAFEYTGVVTNVKEIL